MIYSTLPPPQQDPPLWLVATPLTGTRLGESQGYGIRSPGWGPGVTTSLINDKGLVILCDLPQWRV